MSSSEDSTKRAISAALRQLAAQRPLDKVRAVDIQRAAHVSHRTFYYHFADKFDVVVWTFCRDIRKVFEQAGINVAACIDDGEDADLPRLLPPLEQHPHRPVYRAYVRGLVELLSEYRAYYCSVFASDERRNLRGYLEEANYRALRQDLSHLLRDIEVSEYEMYTIGHYLADADVASVLRLVDSDASVEIIDERGFELISPLTPLLLQFAANYLRARYAEGGEVPEQWVTSAQES